MMLQPGTPVERYIVQAVLGRGGMATVYRVKHAVLGTQHALKVLHTQSVTLQEDLLREGRMQARLDPEYIVPVHDVLTVHGSPGLLMPLVQGCSLQDVLNAYRPTEAEIAAVMTAVARGVGAAHAQGIVHRDLKPANVLLDIHRGRVRVRVADFGLGVSMEQGAHRRGFAGTPAYAPPEQLAGGAAPHPGQDLWALGVMLVECLTGKRPYDGESVADCLRAIEALPMEFEDVPAAWAPLISQLLLLEPSHRGPAAHLLGHQLQAIHGADPLNQGDAFANAVRRSQTERTVGPDSLAGMQPTPALTGNSLYTFMEAEDEAEPARPQSNLPQVRDAFIGRDADLEHFAEHIDRGARLLTLLGIGGTGKTRLAIEYARQQVDHWEGGTWFFDLTEARSQEGFCQTVAAGLRVPLGNQDAVELLGHALAGYGRALFILDNLEQVVDSAATVLRAWLEMAPEARFVVTSRITLGVAEEIVWNISPLAQEDGVALFEERARSARAHYQVTRDTRQDVLDLVAALDRLPLAIELAAARISVMSPKKMLERIGQRFRLLQSRSPESQRHQTLRATLDWSWDLLSEWERSALAQLSAFEGGFDLEAAEAVLDLDDFDDAPWGVDAVQSLIDKSLVHTSGDDRFYLLASVHAYASEKLIDLGDVEACQIRHGEYYASFGTSQALSAIPRHGGMVLLEALRRDLDNLVEASHRALARGDAQVAPLVIRAAGQVVLQDGPYGLICSLTEAALNLDGIADNERARLLYVLARAESQRGRPDVSIGLFDECIQLYRQLENRRAVGSTSADLGMVLWRMGQRDRARECLTEAVEIAVALGNRLDETMARGNLLSMDGYRKMSAEGMAFHRQAIHVFRSEGDQINLGHAHTTLATCLMHMGEYASALRHYEDALAVYSALDNRRGLGGTLSNIGDLYLHMGEYDRAIRCFEEALEFVTRVGYRLFEGIIRFNLADVHYQRGDYAMAEWGLREARPIAEATWPALVGIIQGTMAKVEARAGRDDRAREALMDAEEHLRGSKIMSEGAKLMCKKATVLAVLGDPAAADALAEAERICAESFAKDVPIQVELEEARQALRAAR